MEGRLNLDEETLNLDRGTLTLDGGTRAPASSLQFKHWAYLSSRLGIAPRWPVEKKMHNKESARFFAFCCNIDSKVV